MAGSAIPSPPIVAAAQAAMRAWRVPASVSLAQYGLESAWGRIMPPGSNNPFGMKVRAGGHDPAVVVPTHEDTATGRPYLIDAAFRRFPSIADAFVEHARLLATAPVYAPAFARLPDVGGFVTAMARHYATDPGYAAKLLAIIAGDRLTRFDVIATPTVIKPAGEV